MIGEHDQHKVAVMKSPRCAQTLVMTPIYHNKIETLNLRANEVTEIQGKGQQGQLIQNTHQHLHFQIWTSVCLPVSPSRTERGTSRVSRSCRQMASEGISLRNTVWFVAGLYQNLLDFFALRRSLTTRTVCRLQPNEKRREHPAVWGAARVSQGWVSLQERRIAHLGHVNGDFYLDMYALRVVNRKWCFNCFSFLSTGERWPKKKKKEHTVTLREGKFSRFLSFEFVVHWQWSWMHIEPCTGKSHQPGPSWCPSEVLCANTALTPWHFWNVFVDGIQHVWDLFEMITSPFKTSSACKPTPSVSFWQPCQDVIWSNAVFASMIYVGWLVFVSS